MDLKLAIDLYHGVMRETVDFSKGLFVVRIWDGMDGCWTDCTKPVSAEEALKAWNERTQDGTKNVSYREIDYFCIFPADTRMAWDGGPGREMFRS